MTTADMTKVARIGFSAIQLKKKTPYVSTKHQPLSLYQADAVSLLTDTGHHGGIQYKSKEIFPARDDAHVYIPAGDHVFQSGVGHIQSSLKCVAVPLLASKLDGRFCFIVPGFFFPGQPEAFSNAFFITPFLLAPSAVHRKDRPGASCTDSGRAFLRQRLVRMIVPLCPGPVVRIIADGDRPAGNHTGLSPLWE